MYEIKETKVEYLSVIMRIINMTKEVFAEEGVDQWQKGYPKRDIFLQDIMKNESYTIFDEDCIIGTFMLSKDIEPTYKEIHQGHWLNSDKYAVIHRFTIDPATRRQGLGIKTFQKIETMLSIDDSIKSIRVDTHQDNLGMPALLEQAGYKYLGIIYLASGDKRLAYEKLI